MPMSLAEFTAKRQGFTTQYFPCPDATPGPPRTVMVCSHIWWTDQIALAFLNAGCNVLLHFPLYLLYTDDSAWSNYDDYRGKILAGMKQAKVDFIVGGNAAAMAPDPKTGELLHRAAGVPIVHYWWDEPRSMPPFAKRCFGPEDYLRFMRDERTLNVTWDRDVLEEMGAFYGVSNSLHVPLATLPEYWPSVFVPMEKRPLAACFLGNCHFTADWVDTDNDAMTVWARDVTARKIASPDTSMKACIEAVGMAPTEGSSHLSWRQDPWSEFFVPWEVLNSAYMHRTRNVLVKAAAEHLKGKLALVGKGWEKMGLRANSEHAGDKSGTIYAQSQASLNLFGGCVHGGMPLRPFDIGASGGLIVTHYQRELPALFEVGRECVAFRDKDEMLATLDRIMGAPAEFNAIVQAGRRRVLAEHTWSHRVRKILAAVDVV
jgi:spore maturation protein CgeB